VGTEDSFHIKNTDEKALRFLPVMAEILMLFFFSGFRKS
jgi:hypothetical protein